MNYFYSLNTLHYILFFDDYFVKFVNICLLYSCVNLRQYGDVYMKNACPKTWKNKKIKNLCTENSKVHTNRK